MLHFRTFCLRCALKYLPPCMWVCLVLVQMPDEHLYPKFMLVVTIVTVSVLHGNAHLLPGPLILCLKLSAHSLFRKTPFLSPETPPSQKISNKEKTWKSPVQQSWMLQPLLPWSCQSPKFPPKVFHTWLRFMEDMPSPLSYRVYRLPTLVRAHDFSVLFSSLKL